ncbi:hypothetical protein WA026_018260 [Henosepilachna vigintioctopunctata]|uniref:Uncharacterized protein n=1 Tax=Henosepilachna vigintioctopunctata TaxID=420089 RepID=A0AAW1V8M8_9CUCU
MDTNKTSTVDRKAQYILEWLKKTKLKKLKSSSMHREVVLSNYLDKISKSLMSGSKSKKKRTCFREIMDYMESVDNSNPPIEDQQEAEKNGKWKIPIDLFSTRPTNKVII